MSSAAHIAYLDLRLQTAGKVKGDSTVTSLNRKDLIEVWLFDHEVNVPRDAASGLATGRRIHKPIRWVTPVGSASPVLFQAVVGNETIVKGVFRFFEHDRAGKELEYFRITIEDGTINSMATRLNTGEEAGFHDEYHELEFTFRKITVEDLVVKKSAVDDWQLRP